MIYSVRHDIFRVSIESLLRLSPLRLPKVKLKVVHLSCRALLYLLSLLPLTTEELSCGGNVVWGSSQQASFFSGFWLLKSWLPQFLSDGFKQKFAYLLVCILPRFYCCLILWGGEYIYI